MSDLLNRNSTLWPCCAPALLAVCMLMLAACETEPEGPKARFGSVSSKGGLRSIAEQTQSSGPDWESALEKYDPAAGLGEDAIEDNHPLRITHADESVTLIIRSPRHLMIHILETIKNGEDELFLEQVLSEQTKDEYYRRDRNPVEALEYVKKNMREIEEFFLTMPAGERTPGTFMEQIGRNTFRLQPPGVELQNMKYSTLDMVLEDGMFRLLIIK